MMNDRAEYRRALQGQEIREILLRRQIDSEVLLAHADGNEVAFVAQNCGPIDEQTWDLLEEALARQLDASRIELTIRGHDLVIRCERPHALHLLQILGHDSGPAARAVIGLDQDAQPVILNASDWNAEHVLFLGGRGAGKTAALRTAAVSLALASRQAQVQMVVIAPEGGGDEIAGPGLGDLHYLPHALSAVISELDDIANVLAFATAELQHRRAHTVSRPSIIIFVDDLDLLLRDGGSPVRDPLRKILANGIQSGIYMVMAARAEGNLKDINELLALTPVLRIAGRVDDEAQAREATQMPRSNAEHLHAPGEFLLISEGSQRVFQTAFVDRYDLYWCLERLQGEKQARILAQKLV